MELDETSDSPGADGHKGGLESSVPLPGFMVMGRRHSPALVYSSLAASPRLPVSAIFRGIREVPTVTQNGETFATNPAADSLIGKAYLDRFANLYLDGADPTQPLAPSLFGEPAALPPLLIQVGGTETMPDQSGRCASRAPGAGMDATVWLWPEMTHAWQGNGPDISEAREAVEKAGAWLRKKMGL